MKFRQLLLLVVALMIMGAPAIGQSDPGTPVSAVRPPASGATATPSTETVLQAPVWESVVVSDEQERNNKTKFYRVKPAGEKQIGNGKLTAYFPGTLPEGIHEELAYTRYPATREYLTNLTGGSVSVKEQPKFSARTLRGISRYQHIATDGIVQGDASEKGNGWYRVQWGAPEALQEGYVFAPSITRRGFQFEKMNGTLNRLWNTVENGNVAHVENYKNRGGWAPKRQGQDVDAFGSMRDQAVPAYYQASTQGDFRYLTDGSLVAVLGEQSDFYEITTVDFEGVYYVPKKYIPAEPRLKSLGKVVVVDRKNQNEAVFQRSGEGWKLVSYLMATTGENAPFKQETTLGHFMVMEKKSKFMYLGDVSKVIEGYAPFALRFNGGAYIHGVPVNYKDIKGKVVVKQPVMDALGNVITPAVTRDVVLERKDPGIQEYLSTIGTIPRSHKCVRNYTSHAKFLYDWAEIGTTAVIVIE